MCHTTFFVGVLPLFNFCQISLTWISVTIVCGVTEFNFCHRFPISLQWGGQSVTEKIAWFQHESDPTLNSNVFEVAQSVVQKHFPGKKWLLLR